nr:MAG: major capsid protein [Microvirus sp.]
MQIGSRNNQHSFAQIPQIGINRSMFDRSYEVKDTFEFDYIYPFYWDEVLPGDTFNVNIQTFARLATSKVPIMDRLYASYEFFFVPYRLVWTNFRKMVGEQDNPADSTAYTFPTCTGPAVTGFVNGALHEKMGVPPGIASLQLKNHLPVRAYNLIYREWYRDQNLINSPTVDTGDGPDTYSNYVLRKRAKAHDYFTSALPWPQKNNTGVNVALPLAGEATVKRYSNTTYVTTYLAGTNTYPSDGAVSTSGGFLSRSGSGNISIEPNGTLYADLSTATSATINQWRQAMQLQGLFELDARGGSRFVEIIANHFNTVLPDFTAQRPEYLGGKHVDINSHPVAQTAITSGSNALGQLGAFGTHSASGLGFRKSFNEWGVVMGMVTFRAAITYQQGLHRSWMRSTRYDMFWPMLEGIGEQAINLGELYCAGSSDDYNAFGYQERYAEYRYKPSEIRGIFRSTYSTPIDQWHMAQKFTSAPTLNQTFIESSTPITRNIAVTGEPPIIFDAFINQMCARPMKTYATPVQLGRF